MSAQHGTIGNRDILARNAQFTCLQVTSGFDGDAVVAYRNVAVADVYVLTRLRVDAVRIGGRHIVDGNALNGHIIAKLRVYGPKGRVDNLHALYPYILATDGMYERGTEEATVQCAVPVFVGFGVKGFQVVFLLEHGLVLVDVSLAVVPEIYKDAEKFRPPCFALSVQCPFTLDGDVLCIHGINQRLETFHHDSLMTHFHIREEVVKVLREFQGGSCFQFQSDVTFHVDGTGEISSCGEKEGSSTMGVQAVDGGINQCCVQLPALHIGTCLLHIHTLRMQKRQTANT